jgi:hypothetical protein
LQVCRVLHGAMVLAHHVALLNTKRMVRHRVPSPFDASWIRRVLE